MAIATPLRGLCFTGLLALAGCGIGGGKDDPLVFLEDDPAMRAHPDYPAKVVPVPDFDGSAIIERDQWVTVRDGTRLSVNVFRPGGSGPYPVVMALTAYDKNKGPELYPKLLRHALKPEFDFGEFSVSAHTPWEGPDPAYWVSQGYAVVYVDSRGFASSEGAPATVSMQDRNDFYDVIEWAGAQDWSNGRVGLTGVSYLAIAQWAAASANPPSLKAFIPWEGQTDPGREVLYHGGIPEVNFTSFWVRKVRSGANGNPLPPPALFRFAHQRPALMRWFRSRPGNRSGIDLPAIEVPALICGSWSDQGLHSRGSFEGFKQIASPQKWLYTHGRPKWQVYYSDEALAYQTAFFDYFLKGEDNGFGERAAVRLEVRESLNAYSVREVEDWPLPGTRYTPLYLQASSGSLELQQPQADGRSRYESGTGQAVFKYTFPADTELSGNMKLRLWVSMQAGHDMDLFVGVSKLDTAGEEVFFYAKTGYNRGPVAMGWLRASERALDAARSTPWQPVLAHRGASDVPVGEPFAVDIEILPSSTLFRAGETLRLTIQGRDLFEHPALGHGYPVNEGIHTIHAGGDYDSHLLVPVIPAG